MATICPNDMRPCIDDVCRGCGVCAVTQTELLEQCPVCHQPYQDELSIPCGCEPDDSDSEDCPADCWCQTGIDE